MWPVRPQNAGGPRSDLTPVKSTSACERIQPGLLPETIIDDLGELLDALASGGFQPEHSERGAMQNCLVRFSGPVPLEIVCDRSKFFAQGERAQLGPYGLWRAFDDSGEFSDRVLSYLDQERRAA